MGPTVPGEHVERKLAAILAADVAGYSRLVGLDEEGTLARLKAHRRELIDPKIAEHKGRVVKTTGDGILIEFPSVVTALRCAVEVQRSMVERNAAETADRRIEFRVGIHQGDIVVDKTDILGDGVNVAARLEAIAEPGGICISARVHEDAVGRLDLTFEDIGEQQLKNIVRPVRVYRLAAKDIAAIPRVVTSRMPPSKRPRSLIAVAAVLTAVAAAAVGLWQTDNLPHLLAGWTSASAPRLTAPHLSIVVLPFTNLSSGPDQDYFVDGITDDLTTDLSRISGSFVIARNTAFTYKGKAVDIKQIGRELSVRYVLEGSVRREGNTVRVNAQLIDAEAGTHIWADRFDKNQDDVFTLQSEVTQRIAQALHLELIRAESLRAQRERGNNPDAIDLAMRGWAEVYQPRSREQLTRARNFFEQALRIDSANLAALSGLARVLSIQVLARHSDTPAEDFARADDAVTRVLSGWPDDAGAHYTKGLILRIPKEFEAAIGEFDAAIAIDHNLADAYAGRGFANILVGRAEEAFEPVQKAIQLSPRDPSLSVWMYYIAHAHAHLGQDEETIEWCRKSIAINPYWLVYIDLISAYGWKGQQEEARAAIREFDKLMPKYTATKYANEHWSDNPVFVVQYARIVEGLRKAGLPE